MLEFRGVGIKLGRQVLSDVSFPVEDHKITVLLGKNGCGKSTLIGSVTGLYKYSGEILLDGISVNKISPRQRARRIGVFSQILPNTQFSPRYLASVGRNPYIGAGGILSETDKKEVESAISEAGIAHLADRPCCELSGGERQRAFLAMLLSQDPDVFLLDEPSTYLDADARRELYGIIRRLSLNQNKTVLAVMHDLNEAVRIADNIAVIGEGVTKFYGTKEECLERNIIEEHFSVSRHECIENGVRIVFFE